MLKDHLKDGVYDKQSQEVIQQSKSTPKINTEAERDFGMLDQLKKLKLKTLDITIEAILMYLKKID